MSKRPDNGLLNGLRAGVLGANDGIVSTASVVMGVAGATNDRMVIITAGLAALVAGALSMAVGEYISVSSQRDAEKAAHVSSTNSPLQAGFWSLIAFSVGGFVPFIATVLASDDYRIVATVAAVLAALVITGYVSASVGGANHVRATLRVVLGGSLAMAITYYVGVAFGATFV